MPNEMCDTCKRYGIGGCDLGLDTPPGEPCMGYGMDTEKYVENAKETYRELDEILERI